MVIGYDEEQPRSPEVSTPEASTRKAKVQASQRVLLFGSARRLIGPRTPEALLGQATVVDLGPNEVAQSEILHGMADRPTRKAGATEPRGGSTTPPLPDGPGNGASSFLVALGGLYGGPARQRGGVSVQRGFVLVASAGVIECGSRGQSVEVLTHGGGSATSVCSSSSTWGLSVEARMASSYPMTPAARSRAIVLLL